MTLFDSVQRQRFVFPFLQTKGNKWQCCNVDTKSDHGSVRRNQRVSALTEAHRVHLFYSCDFTILLPFNVALFRKTSY